MAMEDTRFAYFPNIKRISIDVRAMGRSAKLNADPGVFWDLAEPHKQKLYNFIHKSLSFSVESDDVFQETLLRGWTYFGSYHKDKSFSTWLFAIAYNEIRKHFNNARRNIPLPLAEDLIAGAEQADLVLVREVYHFAEGLKPKNKEIFFLFYDSGFSIAEISWITGVREGNVKFMLNRARNILRKRLGANHGKP
jgi:RNA polymerase sigma-70 factor (ECF subfamily)